MKYPSLLSFHDLLPQLDQFDAILDVRSPSEFAEDHIPGAVNYPVLDDEQRVRVGTMYKQVSSFEARKVGAALVARNIAYHVEKSLLDKPREWKPLVYCWRGGNRSGSMAHILSKIGWPVVQLDGGYKEYRRHVHAALAVLPSAFQFKVICGTTGSGKSRLLQTLESQGAQVLDLERLALHRGSVLGNLPAIRQPPQKTFESQIWNALRRFDPKHPVFIESESKKVGNLRVPDALMETMRESQCISLTLSTACRVQLLMQDYAHFVSDPTRLNVQLECLVPLHGKETVARWQAMAIAGQMEDLVGELLVRHYDPAYIRSIDRNFTRFSYAEQLVLPNITVSAFAEIAAGLHKPS